MKPTRSIFQLLSLIGLAIGFAPQSLAGDFCFSLAENYYEQVYCELEAMGKGRELPDFSDFRHNNEFTQALLLKRPAQKVGIQLAMPGKSKSADSHGPSERHSSQAVVSQPASSHGALGAGVGPALSGCLYSPGLIRCGSRDYPFLGNLPNSRLAEGALDDSNRMDMPAPPALLTPEVISPYLKKAYIVYLEKMAGIGLAGSTMQFNKFSYFFYDVADKGVSFNGRFETMFHYLKKDKQSMAIPSIAAPNQLALDACMQASDAIIACASGARNYLFFSSL